jgi:hypothetical protein
LENEWLNPVGPFSEMVKKLQEEIEEMSSCEKTRLCVAVSVRIEENPSCDPRTYQHAVRLETRECKTLEQAREFYSSVVEVLNAVFAEPAVSGASTPTEESRVDVGKPSDVQNEVS